MDRRFHQSIKKHLPHTQHDLYLVNRIVSLYPYIIIALIPLAVCLMLFFLRLTSGSTEIEGGISTILATIYSLISGNVVGQCLDSEHSFPIGCWNPAVLPYLLLWHSVERPLWDQTIGTYRRRSQPFLARSPFQQWNNGLHLILLVITIQVIASNTNEFKRQDWVVDIWTWCMFYHPLV